MKKLDLIGTRFGKLLVLEETRKRGYIYWKCQCDCGNVRYVRTCSLRSGDSPSCGCLSRERIRNLKRLELGQSSFNYVFRGYKNSARRRGFSFDLSEEDFKKLTQMNCYYCDRPPEQYYKRTETYGKYIHNGIDRVDNSLGYNINNCVPCCKRCNRMKEQMTQEEFFYQMKRILLHCGKLLV